MHYTRPIYDPSKAVFNDFEPFWEFVSGPLHAGAFGPNTLDNTFGPQLMYVKAPGKDNASPSEGGRVFGAVNIDGKTGEMKVALKDLTGATLYEKALAPAAGLKAEPVGRGSLRMRHNSAEAAMKIIPAKIGR